MCLNCVCGLELWLVSVYSCIVHLWMGTEQFGLASGTRRADSQQLVIGPELQGASDLTPLWSR